MAVQDVLTLPAPHPFETKNSVESMIGGPKAGRRQAMFPRRAQEDAWLYETCTRCLQHLIDLFVAFFPTLAKFLPRLLELLANFITRPHTSLASVGVAALVRLVSAAGAPIIQLVVLLP